ncbi:MAG: carboxypeptidase-like regulatory domain-containing protein [Saprospiraceae bacterium]|nr:carboxypeptidase-like regulatory domain-containing protein [Saprospiraceae bacterium]
MNIRGEVLADDSGEALMGANVILRGSTSGTTTEWDGSFLLRVDSLPVTLEISYAGFDRRIVEVTDHHDAVTVRLTPVSLLIETVEVTGSRVSDRRKEAPLTVESMDIIAIKETASNDFYDGLGTLKGVDLTTASLGFTIINTRGFNSTSPVRSLQIIDGVDNQAPGLNFSLGNFLGAPELDVLKVDVIQGASSAFYGPNAFNGVIDIHTRDPFLHSGLSASIKTGERNLLQAMIRWAHVFQDKDGQDRFAYKVNLSYLSADDWEARNFDPSFQSEADKSNPGGYDAVNIYGDENVDNSRNFTEGIARAERPGLLIFHRRGYREEDLVDYNTRNFKGNVGLYYKFNPDLQLSGGFNFGSGTTVYQGENRFRLDDIFFWQVKVELRHTDKFFIRAYSTHEDAGKSYDAYATALRILNAAKKDADWTQDYKSYWDNFVRNRVRKLEGYPLPPYPNGFPFDQQAEVLSANVDSLIKWHMEAQRSANKRRFLDEFNFFEPGSARFDSVFNIITNNLANDPENPGTRFYDKSALHHIHGEYTLETGFGDITAGANYRQYNPDSRGTIFLDTAGVVITNREFGVYAGLDKKLIPAKLKLKAVVRADKNENFDVVVSPALSLVFTPDLNNVWRISFSSALRNPTLADQYLNLDVGRAQLLGNISGFDSLVTVEAIDTYRSCLCDSVLDWFDVPPIRPERVRSIEIGYRGTLFDHLWIDAGYYFNWYSDFIGFKIGLKPFFDEQFGTNLLTGVEAYRLSANAETRVTTQGFAVGTHYYLTNNVTLSGNYSWNKLNKIGSDDPIIPAFNTPEHKFNLGVSGRSLPLLGSRQRGLGFNINYKWIEGFIFEGSPQFTGEIPTYDLLDAQVNWHFDRINLTVKLGATNVLDKKQFQTYGGPRVGRLAYISFLYEGK